MQRLPDPSTRLRQIIPIGTDDESAILYLVEAAALSAQRLTGGAGFGADGMPVISDLADVLVRGVARSLLNPEQPLATAAGPFTVRPGGFSGWSDADRSFLEQYGRSHRT